MGEVFPTFSCLSFVCFVGLVWGPCPTVLKACFLLSTQNRSWHQTDHKQCKHLICSTIYVLLDFINEAICAHFCST